MHAAKAILGGNHHIVTRIDTTVVAGFPIASLFQTTAMCQLATAKLLMRY
jgi:hypothetical protein